MAKQTINIGAAPNDGTGDPLRDAFDKTNDNFDELYLYCAGQANRQTSAVQSVTTTPAKLELYDTAPFTSNVVATETGSDPYTVAFSPSSNSEGYYEINFNIACTTNAKETITFELYVNGVASGLVGVMDLNNKDTQQGNVSFNVISSILLTTGQQMEIYVYASGNVNLTLQSVVFNVKRIAI